MELYGWPTLALADVWFTALDSNRIATLYDAHVLDTTRTRMLRLLLLELVCTVLRSFHLELRKCSKT